MMVGMKAPPSILAIMRRPWLVSGLLGLVTFLVFLPAVNCDFVNWDDNAYVSENQLIQQGLSWTGIRRAFTDVVFHNWAPFTVLSYMLDATLFGMRPAGFHLTNVVLHAATAFTVCLALCRMTGDVGRSLAVTALFALHPLRVESVAWVAERKDVLSMFFVGLSLLAYERFCRRPSGPRLAAVTAAMLGSLLCKSTAVTLPGLLLLLDVWPLGRISVGQPVDASLAAGGPYPRVTVRQALVEKLPLVLLSFVFAFFTIVTQWHAIDGQESVPLVSRRIPNALYAFNWYLGTTVWPLALHPVHMHHGVVRPAWLVVACSLGVLAVFAMALLCLRRTPAVTVGLLWFTAALVPVIGIIQAGFQAHADRFSYLPHVGLFLAMVWAVCDRSPAALRPPARLLVMLTMVLAFWVVADRRQIAHWANSETLWQHVLALEPDNAFAANNLGFLYLQQGKPKQALPLLEQAARGIPENRRVRRNLQLARDAAGIDQPDTIGDSPGPQQSDVVPRP